MSGRKFYCFCDANCKFETMTKEQILAAIAEATGYVPSDIDDAFISKLKEGNAGESVSLWVGTEAQFNALGVTAPYYKIRIGADGRAYLTPTDAYERAQVVFVTWEDGD